MYYWYSVSSDGDFKINRSKPPCYLIKYLTHSVCKILHRKRFSTATNLLKVGICSPNSKLQNKPSFRLVAIEKRLGQKMNGCVKNTLNVYLFTITTTKFKLKQILNKINLKIAFLSL
ncbi:hypothetical protein BpHYR1_005606 [Brachionus plicatilis]|uniref:Uncharacterized protein n=1 Tax=Brachionus plicatilis TaxID=10195 RepID=A0A3M7PX29_BRAPC|nr:hypothetical protein BpHYR1_005606 [Brachionus plicatilis]